MAVDSINRLPTLPVPQSNDSASEKEKKREEKGKKQKQDGRDFQKDLSSEDPSAAVQTEISQILDSVKTVQLLRSKPFELKTTKNRAFQEMTHSQNVKNPTPKKLNKLNKSA